MTESGDDLDGAQAMPQEPRKQWHPVLVDGLRYLLGDRLRIEAEHAVSALPTRIDLLVISPGLGDDLESPYDRLSAATLAELESPGEWATWKSLRKLYVDGGLYSLDRELERMSGIGLWLVASRMSVEFLQAAAAELGPLEQVGSGLWEGRFIGSPVLFIHLHELPLSVATLPLLMVYKGPREREIAEFALEQGRQYEFFAEQAVAFHPHAVGEVLAMKGMNVEAYRQLANVKDIVALFGPRILIEEMGTKEAIRAIGEEEVIRAIGEARIRELLARMERQERDNDPGVDTSDTS